MSDKKSSFLEKEIQDLLISAGRDRPNLESSQSTLSPCVRTRQQKEKNRRSLENLSPVPKVIASDPLEQSIIRANSGKVPQVIITQASAIFPSSKTVPSEVGREEKPKLSPSLSETGDTTSGSRLLRSGSVFQDIKHVSRPRTRRDKILKSRGPNRVRLDSGPSSKNLRSILRERSIESHSSNTIQSPISKLLSRRGRTVTSTSVPKDWIHSPLSDQTIVRHLLAILQAIWREKSRKRANLSIVKALLKSSRILLHQSRLQGELSREFSPSQKPFKMVANGSNPHGHPSTTDYEENQDDGDPAQFELDDNCTHYTSLKEVPWDLHKYWQQRYSVFSLYDHGIYMTDDAWFGVTPEPVATRIAQDYASSTSPAKTTIIDLFAGAGGNSIAFALSNRWARIIAIEKDPSVIACAENNAYVYGATNITWVNGDCFEYLKTNASSIVPSETVIFASPPWGGPGYTAENIFDLSTMQPYSVQYIHEACKTMDMALYLPRTSDIRQITELLTEEKKVEIVHYCMEGASKALVAYIPANE